MRARTLVIAGGLAVAAVIALAGAVAAFVYFAVNGVSLREPSAKERRLVVSSKSLAPFGVEGIDTRCESWKATRNLDFNLEIEYAYDSEKCSKDTLVITAGAEIDSSVRSARESFKLAVGAYNTGAVLGGAAIKASPELLTIGEQRYAGVFHRDDEPVGNLFIVRQGRVTHSLLVVGITFSDPTDVRAIFEPILDESSRQFPANSPS